MNVPRATYRVQLHRGFTFADARAIVPYLARLGVSHLYASPFLKARPGSTHGYDVIDHDALNPEIGSEEDLDALLTTLRDHGMRLMLDLVPNHMGVQKADNRWWQDVLEHGQASRYADYFDIDWQPESAELAGKVLLPILGSQYGEVLDRGELALRFDAARGEFTLWYHEHRLPIRPSTYSHLLVPGIDRLAREAPDAADALRALADAFAAVPTAAPALNAPQEDAAARSEALKLELARLCAREPAVLRFIEANARTVSGVPGEPASFDALHALIKGQAYRLAFWRVAADDINYRRFFDINDLAALRAERDEVFEATHRRILRLVADGHADALRIDHPDGLSDPAGYCARLQRACAEALGRDAGERHAVYLVLEKILADHERLPESWPVDGTTGYRFMNVVNGLFVDASARSRFDRLYAAFIEERLDFDAVVRRSKTLIETNALAGDVNRLATALTAIAKRNRHTCDYTRNSILRALVDIVACFPVYRTYMTPASRSDDDRRHVDWAVARAKRQSPAAEHSVYDFIAATLRGELPGDREVADAVARFVERFQQLTAPVMAKGMEDTSFYIYNRLVSLNEVGGNPRTFGFSLQAFHGASQDRAQTWPHTMLATATHDAKRGEDVRTRIDVLSEMPAVWRLALRRWRQFNRRHRSSVEGTLAPSRNDEYLLYQTLLGAWPNEAMDDAALDAFRQRIQAYMLKAVREAKVHTSWVNPYEPYEQALARFVDGLLGKLEPNPFVQDLVPLARRIAHHGCVNSLAQILVKLTSPGVPDLYQGTELWDLSLVDPDNRRRVDYALRERTFAAVTAADADAPPRITELLATWPTGRVKLWLIARVLGLRRERAGWFERAGYLPIAARGTHDARVLAYARSADDALLITVIPRLWTALVPNDDQWPLGALWADTDLRLPEGPTSWRNLLTGERVVAEASGGARRLVLREVLATFPVALLESA